MSYDNQIQTFETGAKRSKLEARYDLLSPIGLRRAAEAAHEGAEKYGEYQNEMGLPVTVYLNHALAHIYQYLAGDRTEDHLGHAGWNLLFACHSEELLPQLNEDTLRTQGCKPPPNPRRPG